jgi:hypothetical protein
VAWSELFTPLPPPYTGQEANFESVHVQSPAAGTCWTCGAYLLETGMVAYWDGMSWIIWTNAEEPIIFSPQTGIHGWDANNAFCVGAFGSPDCMQWTGGPNWIDHSGVVDPTFNTQYLCVWGMGPTDVWIAGSENGVGAVVSHWNGAVWDVVKAPMPGTVNGEGITGIWGVDANNVWVCVSGVGYGKIWYWNGAVWADVTPGGFMVTNPQDIHGVDANNMWISGSAGQLMHFDGTVGTDVSDVIFAAMTLSGVFAYATDDIWMSSQFNQKIFHWDGAIWTDVPHGVISPNFAAWNYISGVW